MLMKVYSTHLVYARLTRNQELEKKLQTEREKISDNKLLEATLCSIRQRLTLSPTKTRGIYSPNLNLFIVVCNFYKVCNCS